MTGVVIWFWISTIIFTFVIYLVYFYQISFMSPFPSFKFNSNISEQNLNKKGYLIYTPGCRIPEMNPYDESVAKFIFKPNKKLCYKGNPPLIESNLTSLYYNKLNFPIYHIKNVTNLNCCYKAFYRIEPDKAEWSSGIKYSTNCTKFYESINIVEEEFVQVSCTYNHKEVYKDYFTFIPSKKQIKRKQSRKLNILIIGMDAVSRINLHRQLPNSYRYLTTELNAIELLGYNKVADNTFVNLMPVLTGKFEKELRNTCWLKSNSYFDNCSFIWNNYTNQEYSTVFGEDCTWMGIFNYQKYGFMKQPTDYYYNTFNQHVENDIGNDKDFNCYMCLGRRKNYNVTLNYIRKFIEKMYIDNTPYFGFFWSSSLSHDYLNYPSLGDSTYYKFFKSLKETNKLNNTALIFMSDHGIRWGGIRNTYQGQLEERLPFVLVILPEWFRNTYRTAINNLKKNTRKLTTPFDLHETLKDFLTVDKLKHSEKLRKISRGYSLFKEIPLNRTCKDADIEMHWCTCQQSVPLSLNSSAAKTAANYIIENINEQLKGYAQCATLKLSKILNAQLLYHEGDTILHANTLKDYTITLQTTPGDAVFEATVRLSMGNNNKETSTKTTESYSLAGSISRLNLYGKQSYCITDFHLKLYCYCNSLII